MRRLLALLVAICGLWLIAPVPSSSQGGGIQMVWANQPGPLAGLGEVYVMVASSDIQVIANGLKTEDVQAAVEGRLEAAGIPVVSKAARNSTTPVLLIKISTFPDRDDRGCLFTMQAKVEQNVLLQRNQKILVMHASTWQKETMGYVTQRPAENLTAEVEDLVDAFIRDYRQVNLVKK